MKVHKSLLLHVTDPFVQIQMLDTARIERGTAAKDAVNFVTFLNQEFGEKGTVLSSDTGD